MLDDKNNIPDLNKVQRTLMCTWLVELKLATLNQSRAARFEAGKFALDLDEFEAKA